MEEMVNIIHNGEVQSIDKDSMMLCSKYVTSHQDDNPLTIQDRFDQESFSAFLGFLRNPAQIPDQCVYDDVLLLLNEWGCKGLLKLMKKTEFQHEYNAFVKYNDVLFPVCHGLMMFKSRYYEDYYRMNFDIIPQTKDTYDQMTFQLFLDLLHDKKMDIEQSMINNIKSLSYEWRCPRLIAQIEARYPLSSENCFGEHNDEFLNHVLRNLSDRFIIDVVSQFDFGFIIRVLQSSQYKMGYQSAVEFIAKSKQKHGISALSLIPFISINESVSIEEMISFLGIFSETNDTIFHKLGSLPNLKPQIITETRPTRINSEISQERKASILNLKIEYDNAQPFKGIFYYFREKNIPIKTSTDCQNNADTLVNGGQFMAKTLKHDRHYIIFHPKDWSIRLTSYTIQSTFSAPNENYHLKGWTMSGSDDEMNWVILDSRTNNSDLNGNSIIKNFSCNSSAAYKYIRFQNTEKSWFDKEDNYRFCISKFEIFGEISKW